LFSPVLMMLLFRKEKGYGQSNSCISKCIALQH